MENKVKISKSTKKVKKNSRFKKIFFNILFLICLGVFLYSAGNVALEYYGSYKAQNDLSSLQTSIVKKKPKAKGSLNEKGTDVERIIDFDKLKELNKDSIGWIEIPGTPVDEPVVQGNNNDYYLWYSFKRKRYPLTGTIFLDAQNKADLSDRISYIFGHNMWDKTKFSCFELFENDQYLNEHKVVNIYTKNKIYKYEVLGVNLVPPVTPLYPENLNRDKDFPTFKKELKKYLPAKEVDKLDENSKILLLVTCKTPSNTTVRRILFTKLIEVENNN